MITVVTRISPVTEVPGDCVNLLKPSDLGKPIEVHKCSLVDPRTGIKYVMETTFCIGRTNALENSKKKGLMYLKDPKTALNHIGVKNITEEFAFSAPKSISKERVSQLLSSSKIKENDIQKRPSIKLHLNLKEIREDGNRRTLIKQREKFIQPLLKYFINSECLICGIIVNEPNKIKIINHMQSHIKLGTYACQECENEYFSTADALFSHSIKHLGKKKYNCTLCNKNFIRKHFLSLHYEKYHKKVPAKKLHSFDRRAVWQKVPTCIACTICKVKLSSSKMISDHKDSHVGRENYLCLLCNKTFPSTFLLRYHSHVRIISKRYSCKLCHKGFSSVEKLQQHKQIHTKKAFYKCKLCAKQFNFRNNLLEHIQLLHS